MKKKSVEGVSTLDEHSILKFIKENPGKILGGLCGLLVAVVVVVFGFWRGLFILFCVSAGIYLGARAENDEGISRFLEKIRFKRERF